MKTRTLSRNIAYPAQKVNIRFCGKMDVPFEKIELKNKKEIEKKRRRGGIMPKKSEIFVL